jgi:hypothetical protein
MYLIQKLETNIYLQNSTITKLVRPSNILVLKYSILESIKFCFGDSQMFHQQRISVDYT